MSNDSQCSAVAPHGGSWDAIFAEFNGWRGACLHHISAVEMAVTETLLALSAAAPQGETVRLRQLIGQRFEDLSAAIAAGGPFARDGEPALAALQRYRDNQEEFRALLCHGAIKVMIDHSGDWTLVIRSLSIRARQAERGLVVIDRPEARSRLDALKSEGQKLASVLGQLRKIVVS